MVEANVVQDFHIGNTRIKIADNYCRGKTEADVQAILRRIAQQAQRHFNAAAATGNYGQTENTKVAADCC